MIFYKSGNFMLEQGLKLITVNCVGVPGKGLALEWAQLDPNAAIRYKALCARKELRPGGIVTDPVTHRWLLVATKDHWRNPSQLVWIEEAMPRIIEAAQAYLGHQIHVPPMGAGLGGLEKRMVKATILDALASAGEHVTPDRSWNLWNF